MPTTPIYDLPYPASGDPADVPTDIQDLATAVEGLLSAPTSYAKVPKWGGVAGDASVFYGGSGDWTAVHNGPGSFTVNFNTPTSHFPLIHVTPLIGQSHVPGLSGISVNGFTVTFYNVPAAGLADCTFLFSAWDF